MNDETAFAPAKAAPRAVALADDAITAWYDRHALRARRAGRSPLSSDDLADLRKQVSAAVSATEE